MALLVFDGIHMSITLYAEGTTGAQQADAQYVLEVLCEVYPGHPWPVRVDGGCVFIRHLGMGKNWGMNAKFSDISHDIAVFKRTIIMNAGAFLERAGLNRGRNTGVEIVHFEGIPEKDQVFH